MRSSIAVPHRLPPDARLALLMHDQVTGLNGKMGLGLLRYSPHTVTAVVDRQHVGGDIAALTGIARPAPIVGSVADAAALGADTLVIAIAPAGGVLPDDYRREIYTGLDAGMSLVNGLHERMAVAPDLASRLQPGRFIWDVRQEPEGLSNGTGAAAMLTNRRVLAVGTDMANGKMTAMLEMERAAQARGIRAKFLASGQIGICISGDGVPLDGIRVDFASGAIEGLVMRHREYHLLLVEGQGSALHPASTAWLPLIRGSVPTHLILCHRAGQEEIVRDPNVKIPPLRDVAALYEAVCNAAGALRPAKVAGIALNCGHLDNAAAKRAVEQTADETGLPTTDAVRFGADALLDAVLAQEKE